VIVGFTDALMVAPLGQEALAATTAGTTNSYTAIILPMGMVYLVQSFAAQYAGRDQLVAGRRFAWYGLALAALSGLVAIACIPWIAQILALLDYQPAVQSTMAEYVQIRLWGVGAAVATEALGNWFGGVGNTRPQMRAGVLTMVANVALNWLLISGQLGAPALGVRGAAWASVIATWLGLAYLGWLFARSHPASRGASGPLRWSEFLRFVRFGLPNGCNWFLEFTAYSVFINLVLAPQGTAVLAAAMVVLQVNSVSFMPGFAIGSSGAILAGQAIGRDRRDEVGRILSVTLLVGGSWQCLIGLAYLLWPGPIIGLFASGGAAQSFTALGARLLAVSAAWQLFDAVALGISETLRAAGDTAFCMWARLLLSWCLFVPAALVTERVFAAGPVASLLSLTGYLAVLAAVMAWRFRSGRWRSIALIETPL
jgi:MATE family multidrug resistance protein